MFNAIFKEKDVRYVERCNGYACSLIYVLDAPYKELTDKEILMYGNLFAEKFVKEGAKLKMGPDTYKKMTEEDTKVILMCGTNPDKDGNMEFGLICGREIVLNKNLQKFNLLKGSKFDIER